MDTLKTVLIVEDQQINRSILKKLLSDSYSIIEAADGRQAISCLEQHWQSISAILLDLLMPQLDGYSFLKLLLRKNEWSKIPVIVVTQDNRKESEENALQLGARDFVSKPYNPRVLKRRLDNLIELYESKTFIGNIEHDEITGLYNKQTFLRYAQERLNLIKSEQYLMIAIELVEDKYFNLNKQQLETNAYLQTISHNLEKQMEKHGGICCRYSTFGFMALVPEFACYKDDIDKLQKYLLTGVPATQYMKSLLKYGVYPLEKGEKHLLDVCERAQFALEMAKSSINDYFAFYDTNMQNRFLREKKMLDEIGIALAQNQFQVYLQPKYELMSETIVGAEALVRWVHPQMGFMNPGEFIPLFEKYGAISDMDLYVWNKTCEILAQWKAQGKCNVPISVNVSQRDIFKLDIPTILKDMTQKHGIDTDMLHLEITETAYSENISQILSMAQQLRDLGFPLEMDDFGSAYSSLNMLAYLPIDVLKLDMRFIQNGQDEKSVRNILPFVISLAKGLGVPVVAEGVETSEQVHMLRSLGCDYAQGYYFARPMPWEEFEKLI